MCIRDRHLITLVSVPRDTAYVFPDGNTAKLNQMLTNAGPEAQCQAVSDVVGVDVSQYMVVGFDGLQSIVEHFGGLDVDLPYGLTYNFYTKDHPDEVYELSLIHISNPPACPTETRPGRSG